MEFRYDKELLVRQPDSYVERARIVLKNHTSRKTLWTELQMAPFAAILALTSMTLVFGLIPLALLDSSIGLGFGFIASLIFFYVYIERQKRSEILDIDEWPEWRVAERYCELIHPDREADTWRRMDAIRRSRD